jgi:N-acyl homoserine lactone hydrolase
VIEKRAGRQIFATAVAVLIVVLAAVPWVGAKQHGPKRPKNVRLYIFDCGVIRGLAASLYGFKPEEMATTDMSVACFLIVDPKGTLMWDVGVIPDSHLHADGTPVTEKRVFIVSKALQPQLASVGYKPEDITYLAFSHYHQDHTANANMFAGSTWLARPVERDAMFAEKPPSQAVFDYYKDLKDSKTILIDKDEYDVFGNGNVILKSAPGHTPGHQVLVLNLKKTGKIILSGDLYHYPEERTLNRVPKSDWDPSQTAASRAMIEDYMKKTGAQLWIQHDYTANQKLKKAPAYYE